MEVFIMEGTVNSNNTRELFEQALTKFKEEHPEAKLIDGEKLYNGLYQLVEMVKTAWENIKNFLLNAFETWKQNNNDKIKSMSDWYGKIMQAQTKPKSYKQNLHDFLGTRHHQSINAVKGSNIYYTNGKNFKGYKRRK
jgi:hypothetical protein